MFNEIKEWLMYPSILNELCQEKTCSPCYKFSAPISATRWVQQKKVGN